MEKLIGFSVCRSQRGWVCGVYYTVFTANQFTAEDRGVRSGGRWLLTALWNGYWAARREAKSLKAKPGEREALGWS